MQIIPKQKVNEYLISYQEYLFKFMLHVLDKCQDSYYQKNSPKELKYLLDL